eukprot:scaffold4470_cov255-Prasinococcus_capsulatus_cf.AAC.10
MRPGRPTCRVRWRCCARSQGRQGHARPCEPKPRSPPPPRGPLGSDVLGSHLASSGSMLCVGGAISYKGARRAGMCQQRLRAAGLGRGDSFSRSRSGLQARSATSPRLLGSAVAEVAADWRGRVTATTARAGWRGRHGKRGDDGEGHLGDGEQRAASACRGRPAVPV